MNLTIVEFKAAQMTGATVTWGYESYHSGI